MNTDRRERNTSSRAGNSMRDTKIFVVVVNVRVNTCIEVVGFPESMNVQASTFVRDKSEAFKIQEPLWHTGFVRAGEGLS